MTLFTLLMLVALAVVAWRRHQSPSRILNVIATVLIVVCLGVVVLEWRRPHVEEARWNTSLNRMQESMGFALGQAVAKSHPAGGDVLVLLDEFSTELPTTGLKGEWIKGLLAGFGTVNLHAVGVGYKPASDAEATEMQVQWPQSGVPFEKVNEWYAGHPGAVAMVSFILVGVGLSGNQPSQMPPLFLYQTPFMGTGSREQDNWLDWVRPGALEAVMIRHSSLDYVAVAAPSSLADVFSNCCDLITPANVVVERERLAKGNP